MTDDFTLVGIREVLPASPKPKRVRGRPIFAVALLALILLGCLCCELIMTKAPTYLDLFHHTHPPDREFWFGTDTMGRDVFSMIWYGGRVSLVIGLLSAALSTLIAILLGGLSGLAPDRLDRVITRGVDLLFSIPSLLLVILIQAILGKPGVLSISLVIGLTGWFSMMKVVRTEVRQLRNSEYVIAARCMGGGFFHILKNHLTPNFIPSIMFMAVMNVRNAIVMESTLSFLGLGLPPEVISWGSMLSLSENALTTGGWWIILIPGVFLVTTLLCMTALGDYLRQTANRKESYL